MHPRRSSKDLALWTGRAVMVAAALVVLATPAAAQDKLRVLATFSILADFVRNVGGDRVEVGALVGPNSNAHVYAPSPADAKKVADAKVVIANGLGFEGWISRLVKASGTKAVMVVATKGIKARAGKDDQSHDHGKSDPHAWQSVANAKVYVANIRDALIAADPVGKDVYAANAMAYLANLDALEQEVRATLGRIPAERRRLITSHDAFGYFEADYGVSFIAPQGVSTEAEASAKDVAAIITQVRRRNVSAVFLENVTDPRLVQRIAGETGAKIGGTLYSDALTEAGGDAPTYIDLIRFNVKQLATALMRE
jgi:zinc/manganese transport system substrate-binding protein